MLKKRVTKKHVYVGKLARTSHILTGFTDFTIIGTVVVVMQDMLRSASEGFRLGFRAI